MRCTAGQVEEYKEGIFWLDVCDEVDIWLEKIRDELENTQLGFSHRTLDQLSGCCKALRNIKDIPMTLIGLAEDKDYERKYLNDLVEGGSNE